MNSERPADTTGPETACPPPPGGPRVTPRTQYYRPAGIPMDTLIRGKAYVLGDNVDTDQIIPAQYLTYNPSIPAEYKMFGKYALSSVPPDQAGLPKGHVPFQDPTDEYHSAYRVIVAGKNFGCGSSREHAPIALATAGVTCVVAEFYARIFYRNAVNGGYLVPAESVDRLVDQV